MPEMPPQIDGLIQQMHDRVDNNEFTDHLGFLLRSQLVLTHSISRLTVLITELQEAQAWHDDRLAALEECMDGLLGPLPDEDLH
jgi:hypothetical protein